MQTWLKDAPANPRPPAPLKEASQPASESASQAPRTTTATESVADGDGGANPSWRYDHHTMQSTVLCTDVTFPADWTIFHAGTMGAYFTWSLYGWLHTLQWPEDGMHPDTADGVTWLELLVNFVVVSGTLPPLAVLHDTKPRHVPQSDPLAMATPQSLTTVAQNFSCTSLQLQRLLGRTVLEGNLSRKIFTLGAVAQSAQPRKGLDRRPRMRELARTGEALNAIVADNYSFHQLRKAASEFSPQWVAPLALLELDTRLSPHQRRSYQKQLLSARRDPGAQAQ